MQDQKQVKQTRNKCPEGLDFGEDYGCLCCDDCEHEEDCCEFFYGLCSEFPSESHITRVHPDNTKYKCPVGLEFGFQWMDSDSGCPVTWDGEQCPIEMLCHEYWGEYVQTEDQKHIGCPAYPCCDLDPNGCSVVMGRDVEWYGHRD